MIQVIKRSEEGRENLFLDSDGDDQRQSGDGEAEGEAPERGEPQSGGGGADEELHRGAESHDRVPHRDRGHAGAALGGELCRVDTVRNMLDFCSESNRNSHVFHPPVFRIRLNKIYQSYPSFDLDINIKLSPFPSLFYTVIYLHSADKLDFLSQQNY